MARNHPSWRETVYCLLGHRRRPSVVVMLDTFAVSISTGIVIALFAGVEGGIVVGAATAVRECSRSAATNE